MSPRRKSLVVVVLALMAGGALPGEMRGCGTDLSDEVDHVAYCQERCEVLCERVVTCGLYIPPEEPPEGSTIEDVCLEQCEHEYNCGNPQLCSNEGAYLSEEEGNLCLDDWRVMSCADFERASDCGVGFAYCPRPGSCTEEELCDPPDWE